MQSPQLLFKSTRAVKTSLKRQVKPKFPWLSSQQDPVKIRLEMIAHRLRGKFAAQWLIAGQLWLTNKAKYVLQLFVASVYERLALAAITQVLVVPGTQMFHINNYIWLYEFSKHLHNREPAKDVRRPCKLSSAMHAT
jgi:hypothetical protein